MRVIAAVLAALALVAAVVALADGGWAAAALHWAGERQRGVQNAMAGAIRAVQAGEPGAVLTLCLLAGTYGFVHAMGPGHGKVLLGGAALAGGVGTARMLAVGLAAALAQAAAAILLVAVGVRVFALSSAEASDLAEGWLAEASRWAMAGLGALIVWRGGRALWRARPAVGACAEVAAHGHRQGGHAQGDGDGPGDHLHLGRHPHGDGHLHGERHPPGDGHPHGGGHAHEHDHAHASGCGHAHGPTPAQVAALSTPRDLALLVGSVALRPCTGALFLLVIAWRFGIPAAGCAAVLAMGLGTALFNGLAIGGGVAARRILTAGGRALSLGGLRLAAALQLAAGLTILILTLVVRV